MDSMKLEIPAKEVVDCWHDDQRMDFLFSAFPPNASHNPPHWKSKIDFWRSLIVDLCVKNNKIGVAYKDVAAWVARNGRTPMGLDVVWKELTDSKEFVLSSSYTQDLSSNSTWVGWGINLFVRKPTLWLTEKAFSPIKGKKDLGNQSYICVKALNKVCDLVVKKVHSSMQGEGSRHNNYMVSYNELKSLSLEFVPNSEWLDVAILTLEHRKLVSTYVSEPATDGTNKSTNSQSRVKRYIKFVTPLEASAHPVSEVDLGIVDLEESEKILEREISLLYSEQTKLETLCKGCVRNKQRVLAKNYLRKKHRLTKVLEKKDSSLSNIQQLLENIHQCKTDQLVVETYRSGISAYKHLRDEGLGVDAVEETMSDLGDIFADQEDISSSLASPVVDTDVTNEELEQELNDLLSEDVSTPGSVSERDLLSELDNLTIGGSTELGSPITEGSTELGSPTTGGSTPSTPSCEEKGERNKHVEPVIAS